MKTAFVFPGQGAQRVGMGKELFDSSEAARSTFEEANEALGEDLSGLIFDGPADKLTLTANTQPCILTVSVAALRAFGESCQVTPDFVAGHSLGEFSALVASGNMSFADAVRTTRARGSFMQEAVPAGEGAMAAIMKLDNDLVAQVCETAAQGGVVSPANFNSPGQVVISGSKEAVDRACAVLKEKGGRVIPLKVSAPFHCDLMRPAADKLDAFLGDIQFNTPSVPIVTNVEASPNLDAGKVRSLLVKQVVSPVQWTNSVTHMIEQGVTKFVEFGPGNVLAGLIKKIDSSATTVSVNSVDGLDKAREMLAETQQ